jgi:hypothetical protein
MLVTKRHRVGFDVSEENAGSNSPFRLRLNFSLWKRQFFGGIGTGDVVGVLPHFLL